MGTTETGKQETKKQRKEMRDTRSKPASEIHKLTELYKQILLLGNCGFRLEGEEGSLSPERGKGDREKGDKDRTLNY